MADEHALQLTAHKEAPRTDVSSLGGKTENELTSVHQVSLNDTSWDVAPVPDVPLSHDGEYVLYKRRWLGVIALVRSVICFPRGEFLTTVIPV
jgi:hypothetical protein